MTGVAVYLKMARQMLHGKKFPELIMNFTLGARLARHRNVHPAAFLGEERKIGTCEKKLLTKKETKKN